MDIIDENAINIYTDGSSYSGPRRGGIGIRFITVGADGNEVIHDEQPYGFAGATNQQMELQACIEALQLLTSRRPPVDPEQFDKIIIKTDSRYVVDNFNAALYTWPGTKWHTRDGAPVVNAQLWKELTKQVFKVGRRVEIHWVKGHKASVHNKAVDKLAKGSAKHGGRKPLTVTTARRKKTAKSVERGSVVLAGQQLTIRVITDEYLHVQRCNKIKYEVMSKASPYVGNVDLAFSDTILKAGHTYYVRMGDDSKNPRVVKVFREIVAKPA